MRNMGHSHHINLEHFQPVDRLEVGERKPKLARTNCSGMHQMTYLPKRFHCLGHGQSNASLIGNINNASQGANGVILRQLLGQLIHIFVEVP